ncbi:CheR family methyltransferase [Dactylosporangium siamense]|uniref:protein-glutamate O-methyltransferase n=1 Tax=Dactylosporangium siamense TaxID=685454 RepID=A0A919PV19_9ACTN|nr:CheR family methyltransferase [Dactylosporangium siamense]GIG49806.1 chemotaxis protein methyltransferase [Dactylosporangium siamense]
MTPSLVGPTEITTTEFQAISQFLHQRTGIRLAPGKETLVQGRLDKRLRKLGLRSYTEYLQVLRSPQHPAETRQAIDLLTTNETFFFREPRHFEFLGQVIAPAHRASRPFRLWSAASSSGEEAYSAAMVLADALPNAPWEVVGTDISSRVVAGAEAGLYPISAAEKIPTPLLRRYCRKGRAEYEGLMAIDRALRARTTFLGANLLEDQSRLGRFDVIMLRNVMIYFETATKAEVVGRLQDMLHPGGYFIVSLSETLNGIPSRLRQVQPSIYQLPGADLG